MSFKPNDEFKNWSLYSGQIIDVPNDEFKTWSRWRVGVGEIAGRVG